MWQGEHSSKKRRSVGRIVFRRLLMLAMLVVLAASALAGLLWLAERPGPLRERAVVLIEPGAGTQQIAERLEREGVISSRHVMLAYVAWQRAMGEHRSLKAGEYAFQPGSSLREVLEVLRAGKAIMHRLTIPEGMSTVQALERIAAHEALSGEISVKPEEGTLLPDTYLFTRGKARDALVRQMMQAQRKLLAELWPKRAPGLPLKSAREAVILASIVEKETAMPEERRRVAAVFINRLKKNMPLQADPTVIYGITKGRPLGRPLTKKDLREKTPWNTYVIRGLPPTPIANPGRASIEAVLDPLQTEELYFVADGTGRHLFAADLKTHNRNVRRLRKIERARARAKERLGKADEHQDKAKGQRGKTKEQTAAAGKAAETPAKN